MSSRIFQVIIKHLGYMFRLNVITNAGLFMLQLLNLRDPMTFQHLERLDSVR